MVSKLGKALLVLILLLIFNVRMVFADPTPTPTGIFHDQSLPSGAGGGASTTNRLSKQLIVNGVDPFTAQDVDANGGFHYTYPLQLPQGTNGMAPKLNLVYNSNGDNGMLGVGWSLQDIPTIERDLTYPVTFNDTTDHYIYNGDRLVYGGDGYWHTKRESYERIQFLNPNTSSSYWVVTLKNGTQMYFGSTTDSHIDAIDQNGQARLWTLNKVIDLQGNYYVIEYDEDTINGDYYPVRITWTKNDQHPLQSVRTVEFSYETRNDHWPMYMPSLINMDKRLKWISVKVGNNLLRKYRLDYTYEFATGRSNLVTIQQYGSNGSIPPVPWVDGSFIASGDVLPADSFSWQTGEKSWVRYPTTDLARSSGFSDNNTYPVLTGDWNGDGKTDMGRVGNNQVSFYTSTGSGWLAYTSIAGLCPSQGFSNSSSNPVLIGDWNGDGKTDIGRIGNNQVSFYTSTGSGWLEYTSIADLSPSQGFFNSSSNPVLIGDWNGDGKTDIGRIKADKIYFYTSTGSGWLEYTSIADLSPSQGFTNSSSNPVLIGDWNGDGKTDIGRIGNNQVSFYTSTGSGWLAYTSIAGFGPNDGFFDDTIYPVLTGDWNGDGKTDFGRVGYDLVYFYISTGCGWVSFNPLSGYAHSVFSDAYVYPLLIGDWNGDGKTDFGRVGYSKIYFAMSTGSGWDTSYPVLDDWGPATGFTNSDHFPIFTGDWNGDGNQDFGRVGYSVIYYLTNCNKPELISSIRSNLGSVTTINYLPAPQVPGAIDPTGKTYPNIADSSPRPLVTQIVLNNGLTQAITYNYTYFNGMVHLGYPYERTGLGFGWMKKTDANTNSYTMTYYRQDDVDYSGRIDKKIQYGADGLQYLETRYQYDKRSNLNNENIKFIYMTNEYSYNYNGETGTPVEYRIDYTTYDNYGNVAEVYNHGDTSVATDDLRQTTEYTYYDTTNTYVVDLPAVERKYSPDLNGVTGLAGETRYYYTNYLLTQKELENGSQDVTLSYGYDAYGNPTSFTDGNNHTSAIAYDTAYQTWVRYQTNPLNQTVETVYDALMRPIQVIDPNGAITETQYDVFSREKAKILPGDDGANPTSRITYWNEFVDVSGKPLFPACEKTELKESGSGYIESYRYYDGLGRLIQEKKEAKNGWTTVDYFYDNSGRQYQTSMPYVTGSYAYSSPDTAVKVKWFEYDPIGRESKIHHSDDTVIQMIYGKYDNYVVDPNGHGVNRRISGKTEDTITYDGMYPSQTEYARTTKLTARDGIRVTDAKGNIFTTSLDMLGRKTGENNPGMGVWSFGYDGNNNLISRTDGKSQTVSILYDELNRPIEKNYPDGSKVNYYYDESGHGYAKGRLTRVVYPGGSESYSYDARGRKTSITQIIDGISKTQSMTYDSLDRVVTQTYPDGELVTFGYEVDGNLKSVNGNSAYVDAIEYTPLNKVGMIQYGNGVQTIYDYYDTAVERDNSANTYFSYRLKGIQTSKSGNSLLNLEYEYDKIDNVKVKRDLNNGNLTENYDYDAQNRLTSASSGVYGSKLYLYDQINNMTQKDGRTYSYNSDRPYAVANDGQFNYTYDANGNMIGRSDGRVIDWDYENRVASISDGGSFAYDSGFRRLKKVENGVTTLYFFDTYEEDYQGGTLTKASKFYFANNQRVAEQSSTEGLRYYHQDHLSSSSAITDVNGVLVLRSAYQPYGSDAFSQGSAVIDYKFTGQEKDGYGLYYYGARYYDPELGRFISPDPAQDGLNWYAYCNDNPVKYVDPTGLFSLADVGLSPQSTGLSTNDMKEIDCTPSLDTGLRPGATPTPPSNPGRTGQTGPNYDSVMLAGVREARDAENASILGPPFQPTWAETPKPIPLIPYSGGPYTYYNFTYGFPVGPLPIGPAVSAGVAVDENGMHPGFGVGVSTIGPSLTITTGTDVTHGASLGLAANVGGVAVNNGGSQGEIGSGYPFFSFGVGVYFCF